MTSMVYSADCRGCDREINHVYEVTKQTVLNQDPRRIRCAECRTTNYIKEPEPIND